MAKFMVHLTTPNAPAEAFAHIEADTADKAGELALQQFNQLEWSIIGYPRKGDIDTPCVDEG